MCFTFMLDQVFILMLEREHFTVLVPCSIHDMIAASFLCAVFFYSCAIGALVAYTVQVDRAEKKNSLDRMAALISIL